MRARRIWRHALKGMLASAVVVSGATLGVSALAGAVTGHPTKTTLAVSPSSVSYGSATSVTLSGSVTETPEVGGYPTGHVAILETVTVPVTGCTDLPLTQTPTTPTASTFTCTIPGATVATLSGSYTFYAVYGAKSGPGGTRLVSSTGNYVLLPSSATASFGAAVPTTTTLTVTPPSVRHGSTAPVTLSGTVAETTEVGTGYPTGTVTITMTTGKPGAGCTAPLTLAQTGATEKAAFSCTLSGATVTVLAVGTHTFEATYPGGTSSTTANPIVRNTTKHYPLGPSTSASVTFHDTTPSPVPTTTTLAVSPTSVILGAGTPVTLSGTVAETTEVGTGYPTGTVAISMTTGKPGAGCTAPLTLAQTGATEKGAFSCTLTAATVEALAADTYSFKATYAGGTSSTGNYTGLQTSTSAPETLSVAAFSPGRSHVTVATPGAPTLTTATPGTAHVHLAWIAPSSNGGAAITDYEVCFATTSAAVTACSTHETAGTATALTVTGLTNGTTYFFAVKAENAKGFGPLSNTKTATPALPPAVPVATAVFGATADATAQAVFARAFPATKDECPASRAAVVATTKTYQDALSSQYLAQALTTGTLLTPTTTLSPVTASALKQEGIKTVYIVGGPKAVTTTVAKEIADLPAYGCGGTSPTGKVVVQRIFGETQYGTAEAIAEHVGISAAATKAFPGAFSTQNATGGTGKYNDTAGKGSKAPAGAEPTAILASGQEFQDAQAASVISYRTKLPLLLTPASTLSMTAVAAIRKLGIKQVILMGGPLAVRNSVEAALVAKTGVSVLRVAGVDYTDTAGELARFETAGTTAGLGWTPGHKILVTRGNGFTDGIVGAVLDNPHNTVTGPPGTARPLLLTENPTTVGTHLTTFLEVTGHTGIAKTRAKTITSFTVLGGPLAVSTTEISAMETALSH